MGWGGEVYITFSMTGASVSTHLLASLAKLPMASPLLQEPGTGDWGDETLVVEEEEEKLGAGGRFRCNARE